ncbi:MAG: ergothioneine biosynthesis protein EgtB [Candidatus Binatia bacterium]
MSRSSQAVDRSAARGRAELGRVGFANAPVESYHAVRQTTESLTSALSDEDCAVQSMPDASPAKWHLAHTTWFFETFVLKSMVEGYKVFHPRYEYLFNSYYNTVGPMHPRPERGMLTRPGRAEILAYRAHVDAAMERLLSASVSSDSTRMDVVVLGLHHEQQHQELLLTDIKHALSRNPLMPAYAGGDAPARRAHRRTDLRWHAHDAGLRTVGADGAGFAYDNERPQHRVFAESFELASRPVSSGEIAEFIAEGGYRRPEIWLSDGWAAVRERGWQAPLYWQLLDGAWHELTLRGLREIDRDAPACHLSFYEADAYATWAGARLATEAEWETAATGRDPVGNFVESGELHPAPSAADNEAEPSQMFGDVWEWTASPYVAYPGYRAAAGALGEYNGKFMSGQMVLRGGSCATPGSHIRATYRNFFPPDARWQFSGLRLARDAS